VLVCDVQQGFMQAPCSVSESFDFRLLKVWTLSRRVIAPLEHVSRAILALF
jgi:hypothetical protein